MQHTCSLQASTELRCSCTDGVITNRCCYNCFSETGVTCKNFELLWNCVVNSSTWVENIFSCWSKRQRTAIAKFSEWCNKAFSRFRASTRVICAAVDLCSNQVSVGYLSRKRRVSYKCNIIIWVSEWVSRSLTSHSTLYRSFRGRFLQTRWPNQQRQSTEIGFSPTRTTPLCYNMN